MNKVILSGIVKDALEPKKAKTGKDYLSFTLAVDKSFGSKHSTEYYKVMVWNSLVQELIDNSAPGYRLMVEGRLNTSSYDDPKTGEKKYSTQVVAERFDYFKAVNTAVANGKASTPFSVFEEVPF